MTRYRPNDYRTPRTIYHAFGNPYAELHHTKNKPDMLDRLAWIAALMLAAFISWLIFN